MGKPFQNGAPGDTYRPRFTIAGDTIPPSLAPGPGGGSNRTYYETGDSTDGPALVPPAAAYLPGTRFIGLQEQGLSSRDNRAHWWLANAVDYIFEGEIAPPQFTPIRTSAGDAQFQISDLVYLGETGDGTDTLAQRIGITTAGFNVLFEGTTHVVATDLQTLPLAVSMYPGAPPGALSAVNVDPGLIDGAPVGTNLKLQPSPPAPVAPPVLVAGDSVINYSLWLRHIRDDNPVNLPNAFATVEVVVGLDDYTMHRDIQALGWAADDEIYITHWAYQPMVVFNIPISAPVDYRMIYGEHAPVGRLGRETSRTGKLFHPTVTAKTLNKLIPLSLAQPESASGWQYSSTGGTQWMIITGAGGPNEYITIPVLVPHGSTIQNITMMEMNSGALATVGSLSLYKEPYTGARTQIATATFDNLAPAEVTLGGGVGELVDLGTNEYYIEIASGFAAGPITVTIYAIRVQFDYPDIGAHIE